jgi:hypothetical protein
MAIPQYNIDEWFAAPKTDNGQQDAARVICEDAKRLADTINRLLPDGDGKINAIGSLRQVVLQSEQVIRWQWPAGKLSIV